ncbi:MAG: glycosyltransferase family 4 protein [Polyangiaceae bacterium]|nr:glycosyltransferase family 4 protein [Polyangiaceae bacterium]
MRSAGGPGPAGRLTVLLHGEPRATQQGRLGVALLERGHRVVVCDAPRVAAQIRAQRGGCEELRVRRPLVPPPAQRWWASRQAAALGVDVVHVNYVEPHHGIWSRMEGGPPYVVTAWGSDLNDEDHPKSAAHARGVDHVLSRAAALTADTPPLLEKARRRAGPSGAPAEVVLWGVDLREFDAARAREDALRWRGELDIAPDRPVVLSPRQIRRHYHVDRIIRAFADSALGREGGVLVLKLHGRAEEAEDRRRLEEVVDGLGIRAAVRFARGCRYDELPGLYALATVAVSALEVDGMPSTFCELLALGVPLVATDLPAYRGALEPEERALLVPPGDHGALVAALDRVAREPGLAAGLAARGEAWARSAAEWGACVDRFEALYRAAIEAGRGR